MVTSQRREKKLAQLGTGKALKGFSKQRAAASLAPWGAPEQVLSREVVGFDLHFKK